MSAATTAITDAINAKFASPVVLTFKQSQTATKDHVVLFVSRRYVADQLASGEVTIPGSRVVTRYVCLTEANLDVYRDRVKAALEDQILTGGVGPFVFESADVGDLEPSGGVDYYVAADTWTF